MSVPTQVRYEVRGKGGTQRRRAVSLPSSDGSEPQTLVGPTRHCVAEAADTVHLQLCYRTRQPALATATADAERVAVTSVFGTWRRGSER